MSIKTINAVAWIPIRKSLWLEDRVPSDQVQCISDLLCDLPDALKPTLMWARHINVKLDVPSKTIVTHLLNANSSITSILYDADAVLHLRIEVEFHTNTEDLRHRCTSEEYFNSISEHIPSLCCCNLASALPDIFLLSTLAYPGRITTLEGCVFYNEFPLNEVTAVSGIRYPQVDLPQVGTLGFYEVLNWEKSIQVLEKGYGSGPVGRAFSAFTYIAGPQSTLGSNLFRAMQGLEAFYCKGRAGVTSQLLEKLKLFLGQKSATDKEVRTLYELRSNYVHGSFPIERWRNDTEMDEAAKISSGNLFKSENTAINLLVVTLQECVRQRIRDIDFSWNLNITTG